MSSYRALFVTLTVFSIPLIFAKDNCKSTKPDFKAPNRTISEERCIGYKWEKRRLERCSNETANTQFPYMGAMGYRKEDQTTWSFLCGAFLISPKFAVTAGQCFKLKSISFPYDGPQIVRFGNSNLNDDVSHVDAKVLKTHIHPLFKPPTKAFDIGLIEFEEAITLSKSVMPVCLWSKPTLEGMEFGLAAGWGTGVAPGRRISKELRQMKVKLLEGKACEEKSEKYYNKHWKKVEDHQFCGDESVADDRLCQGSSGVPLVTPAQVAGADELPHAVGVTSFGARCPATWSVYTRVSSFVSWLEGVVWPDAAVV